MVAWWKDAVCYQIYPRSFNDSNGDGIGDLRGVIQKLDYLKWLGVNALWLSPFFPSPNLDVGYDVSDYLDVDPDYGTLADFDELLKGAHQRGIRILLDLVLNHTSDQHEWFKQSRQSRDNKYSDWYVWVDGEPDTPPNDWESIFGGSAWEYVPERGQYYYHYFLKEQPDLNWRNAEVQKAMFDTVRFWLDKGVDGFRLDAIGAIFEHPDLPNAEVDIALDEIFLNWMLGVLEATTENFNQKVRYQDDLPENHLVLKALRRLTDQYDERILLGESHDVKYYGNGVDELHSVFNFELLFFRPDENLDARKLRRLLKQRANILPREALESNTIGNHDRTRSRTYYGSMERYKIALTMMLLLKGTPVIYNGEEIGMQDFALDTLEQFTDTRAIWVYDVLMDRRGKSAEEALHLANEFGRDKSRTPMQWNNAPNAGFSPEGVSTWLPINPDYADGVTVVDQKDNPDSVLHFLRNMIRIRQSNEALRHGDMEFPETGDVLTFWRKTNQQAIFVALNMTDQVQTVRAGMQRVRVLYSSESTRYEYAHLADLTLQPYQIFIAESV